MVTSEEITKYKTKYEANQELYGRVSDRIVQEFMERKKQSPNSVRVVFSREPKLKKFQSIIDKIQLRREQGNPEFSYDDVQDIIALTVLCPYRSDLKDFINWMRKCFSVLPDADEDALKEYDHGHRAYHFVVSMHEDVLISHAEYKGVKCEVQVKTVLEEGFDAKTHDITYKPGSRVIDENLKKQFAIFSNALKAMDAQSEFMKDLIVEEERIIDLKRKACVKLFLRNDDAVAIAQELDINVDDLQCTYSEVKNISDKLTTKGKECITLGLCRLAAFCSLMFEDDYLESLALDFVNRYVTESNVEGIRYISRGAIQWAFGRIDDAIWDTQKALEIGLMNHDEHLIRKAKNNYVYFISEGKSSRNEGIANYEYKANELANDLNEFLSDFPDCKDTMGLYFVSFGSSAVEIEKGRGMLKASKEARNSNESYERFFNYHDYMALKRLIRIAREAM